MIEELNALLEGDEQKLNRILKAGKEFNEYMDRCFLMLGSFLKEKEIPSDNAVYMTYLCAFPGAAFKRVLTGLNTYEQQEEFYDCKNKMIKALEYTLNDLKKMEFTRYKLNPEQSNK